MPRSSSERGWCTTDGDGSITAQPAVRHLKGTAVAILRLLGAAVVLAPIILLVEVVADVFIVEMDALFR